MTKITKSAVEGCVIMESLGLDGGKALGEYLIAVFQQQERDDREVALRSQAYNAWQNVLAACPVKIHGLGRDDAAEIVPPDYMGGSEWGNASSWVNLDAGNGVGVVVKFQTPRGGYLSTGVYHPAKELEAYWMSLS